MAVGQQGVPADAVWRYREDVWRLASQLSRHRQDAEDVTRSALLKAAQHVEGFRWGGEPADLAAPDLAIAVGAGTDGGVVALVFAGIMTATAVSGFCPLYLLAGRLSQRRKLA